MTHQQTIDKIKAENTGSRADQRIIQTLTELIKEEAEGTTPEPKKPRTYKAATIEVVVKYYTHSKKEEAA